MDKNNIYKFNNIENQEPDEEICPCCAEKISSIQDFIDEFIDVNNDEELTIEYLIDMLEDFYENAKTAGKRSALEQLSDIALNIAYADIDED